jgi:hypothetical protein
MAKPVSIWRILQARPRESRNMRSSVKYLMRAATMVVGLVVCNGAVQAHHSFAPFDMGVTKTIDGTVKQVDWTNPHIWVWVDVQNAQGGVDAWGFEGMSPNYLGRRGWTRNSLKPGDKITVTYRPLRDGKKGGMFVSTKAPDGRLLSMQGGQNPEP